MLGWLEQIPAGVLRSRPVLNVGYAGTLLSTGTTIGVEQRLLDAEQWLTAAEGAQSPGMVVVDEAVVVVRRAAVVVDLFAVVVVFVPPVVVVAEAHSWPRR